MSVFGGDSWAREAQQRKRRVDDLTVEALDGSSYRKLSNGKFACLVCPTSPVLDSPLMLSKAPCFVQNQASPENGTSSDHLMHRKGSKHRAAESRLKERELNKRDEINKRIALSGDSSTSASTRISSKPLVEQTRRPTSEVLGQRAAGQDSKDGCWKARSTDPCPSDIGPNPRERGLLPTGGESDKVIAQQQVLDFRERREKELKFTSAGWKRDSNGRWFKDENVEFDSDEEDPNVCLAYA